MTNGVLPHVWQLFLNLMEHTMQTCEWANPDTTDLGRLLKYFSQQILKHVRLSSSHRLALGVPAPRTLQRVYITKFVTDDFTQHAPVASILNLSRILLRYSLMPQETILNCLRVRLYKSITASSPHLQARKLYKKCRSCEYATE